MSVYVRQTGARPPLHAGERRAIELATGRLVTVVTPETLAIGPLGTVVPADGLKRSAAPPGPAAPLVVIDEWADTDGVVLEGAGMERQGGPQSAAERVEQQVRELEAGQQRARHWEVGQEAPPPPPNRHARRGQAVRDRQKGKGR